LTNTNLTNATLTGVTLTATNLTGANLTGANLTGATLISATLTSANLSGSTLTNANLSGANFKNTNLGSTNFSSATLRNIKSGGISGTPTNLASGWVLLNGYLIGPNASNRFIHLEAGDTASYGGSGTTWNDLSGNGKHATMVSDPAFVSGSNGRFAFDGVNDYFSLPSGFADFTNGITIIVVADMGNADDYERLIELSNGSADEIVFTRVSTTNDLRFRIDSSIVDVTNGIVNNTRAVYAVTADGSTVRMYRNGVLIGSSSSTVLPTNITRNNNFIGLNYNAALYSAMSLNSVMIYNTALSSEAIYDNYVYASSRYIE
jgi:uncharacterized protein YjbI with pentapeptide repeats